MDPGLLEPRGSLGPSVLAVRLPPASHVSSLFRALLIRLWLNMSKQPSIDSLGSGVETSCLPSGLFHCSR